MEKEVSKKLSNVDLGHVVREAYPRGEMHQVWYCKTIQNKKGLYYLPDEDLYVEATLNGDDQEVYLDEYTKVGKKVIKVGK